MICQRITGLLEANVVRQHHRQLVYRHRNSPASGAMDDGNRATPIALTRDQPVAQTVMDRADASARTLHPPRHFGFGALHIQSVQKARMGKMSRTDIGLIADRKAVWIGSVRNDYGNYGQMVFPRKF